MAALRGTDQLTAEQRVLARSLRQAARIVGHAGLPAEYRAAAFCIVVPRVVARADPPPDPPPDAPAEDSDPRRVARTW